MMGIFQYNHNKKMNLILKFKVLSLLISFFTFSLWADSVWAMDHDLSCEDCVFADQHYREIPQDTPQSCGPERNYLQAEIELLKKQDVAKNYFTHREPSQLPEAQFPQKCVHFAMKYFAVNIFAADKKPVPNFATCNTMTGLPQHGHYAPCITEDYINFIYNSFIDVTHCLDLPQRSLLPKILNESGFHLNTFAPLRLRKADGTLIKEPLNDFNISKNPGESLIGGDAGIGQLTMAALTDVKENLSEWREKIWNSPKASCQRIKNFIKELPPASEVQTHISQRCSVIKAPANPMLSFIYYGIFLKTIERDLAYRWSEQNMEDLAEQSGLPLSENLVTQIKEMLFLLAYNAGADISLNLFKEWLKLRIDLIETPAHQTSGFWSFWSREKTSSSSLGAPVTLADLDFSVDLPKTEIELSDITSHTMIQVPVDKLTRSQAESLFAEYRQLASITHRSSAQQDRFDSITELNLHKISFPLYLKIFRSGNAKGYLTYIRAFAYIINKNMGSQVCTDDSFLTFR